MTAAAIDDFFGGEGGLGFFFIESERALAEGDGSGIGGSSGGGHKSGEWLR